jgi:DNA-binding NarL/FixJ family response regulator
LPTRCSCGLSLLDKVGKRWPTVARVLLSGSHDASLPGQARNLGLMAFLPKTLEPVEIAGVIGQVLAGEVWYPAEDGEPDTPRLTPRQASALQAVASGQANRHIARSLGVSESTVKFHLEEAFARLAVSSRAEAVARALQQGLISLIR